MNDTIKMLEAGIKVSVEELTAKLKGPQPGNDFARMEAFHTAFDSSMQFASSEPSRSKRKKQPPGKP